MSKHQGMKPAQAFEVLVLRKAGYTIAGFDRGAVRLIHGNNRQRVLQNGAVIRDIGATR